jgi:4-amino-4-deoxy-L-arabinose transferase-like glycosyltransferase
MFNWIAEKPYRFLLLLGIYFAAHVAVRVCLSDSLDLDESEQTFFSQWLKRGYNSQPPFYNWGQAILIRWFGPSVFVLALFKNVLLCLTYVAYFYAARLLLKSNALAIVAALGLLTIPQIAWESQRDLAHTVAATLAASVMVWAILRTVRTGHAGDYVLTGAAIGAGLISKYNTALIVAALAVALVTIPEYRGRVLNPKILYTVLVAVLIVTPHLLWVVDHADLASGNTIAKLSANDESSWGQNVLNGAKSLGSAIVNFCAVPVAVFLLVFGRTFVRATKSGSREIQLLNRIFLVVFALLLAMVLTGKATAFKDRWLQPVLFLLPLYFVLKMKAVAEIDRRLLARFAGVAVGLMVIVTAGLIHRTAGASLAGNYRRLNIPYRSFSQRLRDDVGETPGLFVTNEVWIAGNLKLQFPEVPVVSSDAAQMKIDAGEIRGPAIAVSQSQDDESLTGLSRHAAEELELPHTQKPDWKTVTLPYLYGRSEDRVSMNYAVLR